MYSWLQRIFNSREAGSPLPTAAPVTEAVQPLAANVAGLTEDASPSPARVPRPSAPISWLQRSEVDAYFTHWLFEEHGQPEIFANPMEKEILGALDKIVKSNQSGANLVRRMPGVIPQLLQSLRTEDFSGSQLARKISNDVVLVAAVIRIANSSFYNPGKTITSIEHAVLVLGHAGLRQLITSVAFQPIIDMNSGPFTKIVAPKLWEQSEKCAIASRVLARDEKADPFEAFLAGLIQNVGLIVSLRVLDQMYDGKHSIGSENFCNALIQYGRILSCSIGKEWYFPESVTTAIAQQDHANKPDSMSGIAKALSIGDYLSKMHMLGKHGRLDTNLTNFTKDLSEHQLACLNALNQHQEDEI